MLTGRKKIKDISLGTLLSSNFDATVAIKRKSSKKMPKEVIGVLKS